VVARASHFADGLAKAQGRKGLVIARASHFVDGLAMVQLSVSGFTTKRSAVLSEVEMPVG